MKTWEKILLYPIGLYLWLTDGIKKMSKKWKPAMAMLMAVVMLCGMLPTMVTAAGWSGITVLGFNYGDDGFLSITAPSTVGNYTYGTANGDTAAETAVNQSVLPESGWQWALKRESSNRYRLILNDFNITYSGNDDIMMSNTDLIIELRGSNSLVKTSSSASGSGIASNMGCTLSITGEGSLNVAGCSYAIYTHLGSTLTIESGNVTLGASYSTIYASKVELGEYVTAQSSLNSDGSNPSSFASGSRPGNYKWFQTVTNIPKYTLTFDANGGSGAMSGTTILATTRYVLPECTFTAPSSYKAFKAWEVNGEEKYDGETITVTEDTTIKALWMSKDLGIQVGAVSVTTDNASNIVGDGISGTVSYDYKTKTLTLNNTTIYSAQSATITGAIISEESLTIKLIGDNTLYGERWNGSEETVVFQHVIKVREGNLDIVGDGSLTINGKNGATHSSYAIGIPTDSIFTVGGDCTVILNPADARYTHVLGYGDTLVANDSTIFVSKSLDDEPLEVYDPAQLLEYKYMKIVPKYDVEINFDANGGTGTMNAAEAAAATDYTLPENGFTAPAGKQFKNWEVDGTAMNPGDKVFLIEDFTVKAIWKDIPHTCSIEPVEKVWPDCENGGKEAYYKCEGCGKFFEDANGTTEIADIATWGNLPKNGHTEGTAWEKDATHHWHICAVAGCDAVIDSSKEAHSSTGTNVATCQSKAVCDDCGATYGEFAGHDWNTASWEKDATGHWHKCNTAGCTEKNAFAAHDPDHQGGATEEYAVKCSVCHYEIEAQLNHTHVFNKEVAEDQYKASGATCTSPAVYYKSCACGEKGTETFASGTAKGHTEGTEWKSDKDNHWHICSVAGCGAVIDSSKAAHTPDRAAATETDPVKCSVCGYEITPALGHTHAHGTEWKSDKDNHWNECACGDKANTAAHKDENADGKCDVCAYNVGLPTPPADPDNPQTGDNTQLGLWIALLIVSSFGIVAITLFSKKKYSAR